MRRGGKEENTSNEGERAGTPTPTPTTLTTTNNTHATGGGGGETTTTTTTKSEDANKEDAMMMSLQQKRKREALRKEEEEIERREKDDAKWRPVCLSRPTMAKGIELMDDGRMVASSQKGYRCVQGTRGVEPVVVCQEEEKEEGMKEDDETRETTTTARYFEVKIEHLGGSGCVRVGWMTNRGEMNAPVGFDNKGYGYHAETGSKYHEARLKTYGEPYGEGDVVGCYLYLDEKIVEKKEQVDAQETSGGGDDDGVKNEEAKKKQTPSTPERNKKNRKGEERLKAKAFEENQNSPNEGKIVFYKNGKCQGIAFESLRSCVHPKKPLELSGYFPTAALYTTPLQDQSQRARVSFNFGPDFAFPIDPEKDGLPKCSGFSPDLDPPKPPPPLVPEKIEDGGTHVPALGSVENAVIKLEETEQKEEEEEEEEERRRQRKSTLAHQKKRKKKEAPMMEVKQEEEDEGKETETEKKKKKCVSLVSFLLRWNRRHFFEVGKTRPDPARLDAYVVEAVVLPSKMRRKMWKKRKKNCLKPPKRRQQETTIPSTSSQISTWKQTKATTEETSSTTGSLVNVAAQIARDRYTTFIRKLYHAYKNALNSIFYNALSLTFTPSSSLSDLHRYSFPAASLHASSSAICFFFSFGSAKNCAYAICFADITPFLSLGGRRHLSRAALSC